MKAIIILLSLSLSFSALADLTQRQWISCINFHTGKCKAVPKLRVKSVANTSEYIVILGYDFFPLIMRCKHDTLQYGLFCDEHSAETVDTAEDKAKYSTETEYEVLIEKENYNLNESPTKPRK